MLPQQEVGWVYRSVFSASPDALLLIDAQGAVVLANPAAGELFGYAMGELEAMHLDGLVPACRHERAARVPLELSARRKDGSQRMVEIALSALEGSDPRCSWSRYVPSASTGTSGRR